MALFVGIKGPRASRDEPYRQEGQVKPGKRAVGLVDSDAVGSAGDRRVHIGGGDDVRVVCVGVYRNRKKT